MKVFPVLVSIISFSIFATQNFVLTENEIEKLAKGSSPSKKNIEASFLEAKKQLLSTEDALAFTLGASANNYKSKEKLLSSSDGGVSKEYNSYEAYINKPLRFGANIKASVFSEESSNAFINGASTTGMSAALTLDLFQDFLGRTTNNNLNKNKKTFERAKLEKEISLKNFEINIRKIYWSLIANNERHRLLTKLVKLSKQQFDEALKRRKSGVADSGEVARYRSQWTTRNANLLSIKYRRFMSIKSLKELLPELVDKEITLGEYKIDQTIGKVLTCSMKIQQNKMPPLEFSHYDDIVKILAEEELLAAKITDAYNAPSLTLSGEYASVGRGFGTSQSKEDFLDDGKAQTSIGVNFTVPLGGEKTATKKTAANINRLRYQSKAQDNLNKMKAFHIQTYQMISILQEVLKNQKETNYYLDKSLKVSRKKFRQARISVQELISEQDSQLQSELNEIDTKLTAINTLMDYFSVFTQFPCEINRASL